MALKNSLQKGSAQPLQTEAKMSSPLAKAWAFSTAEVRSTQGRAAALLAERTGCRQKHEGGSRGPAESTSYSGVLGCWPVSRCREKNGMALPSLFNLLLPTDG